MKDTTTTIDETPTIREQIRQKIEFAVQGVQEIPHKPIASLADTEAIAESMQHYFDERAKWIDLETDEVMALISQSVIEAKIVSELSYAEELLSYDGVLNDKYLMKEIMDRAEWCREELKTLANKGEQNE